MKSKLLTKLRRIGRNKITIHSVSTNENDTVIGMSYGFNDDEYNDLFELGDTIDDVKNKAARVYINNYLKTKTR